MVIQVNPPSQAIVAHFSGIIDAHVESVAQSRGYNSAASCASYVTDPNPVWAAEAQAFVAWRSAVWTTAMTLLSTSSTIPEKEAVMSALPQITWPA